MMLSGWGRFPRVDCRVLEPLESADVETAIQRESSLIARGNGRAYGDPALNPRATLLMRRLERLIDFNPDTGLLVCEAGTLLADIVDLFVPRGWFLPVTPGTKFVTIGGMVAADVHGKNHHIAGSFGRHVVWLDLALADGRIVRCSPQRACRTVRSYGWRHGAHRGHSSRRISSPPDRDELDPADDLQSRQSRRGHDPFRRKRRSELFRRLDRLPGERRPAWPFTHIPW